VARLTLYRPTNTDAEGSTGIEVNGYYHTSLQLGSFSQLCLSAPTSITLNSRLILTGQAVKDYPAATATFKLKPAQDTYIRVSSTGNTQTRFDLVDARIAKAELRQPRRQSHAVSRVPQTVSCDAEASPATASATLMETITLGSDALFQFGKSDINSILPYGRADLDRLIERLKTRYSDFESIQIRIVGHADPLGTKTTNQRISVERAQTIRNYMIQGGIDHNKIISEGRGASQPVMARCAHELSQQSIACHKPNRRVVVDVSVLVH
jgi:outer membrane protein OmpA-like peptidoglycan-associated protein